MVAKLTEAFQAGAENPDFLSLMDSRGFRMLSLSGDEAEDLLDTWQRQTAWVLWDAEIAKTSPEEFGIERP